MGAAIARAFADAGASVVVNSSSSPAAGEELAAAIDGAYVQADISDPADAARLVASAVDRLGRLDVLVNAAGTTAVIPHDDLEAVTPEVWKRILGVNLLGTWSVTAAAVPHLKQTGAGVVINITSTSGERVIGSSIPYAVSKAALNHLTRLLAKALGPEVRVNAVSPGMVDTPWTEGWDREREWVFETVPLRRTGRPGDIAAACVLLADNPYITGAVVPVDGGLALL